MQTANHVVTLVVAAARNGVIGRSGDMPWRMPSSLKRFRALTMGRPMIMGRKTFEAIGRPLDGRDSIVVTRNPDFAVAGVFRAASLAEAFAIAARLAAARATAEIIIAGGGEIYAAALPYATRVHLDLIDAVLDGDTVFPDLDPAQWRQAARSPMQPSAKDEFAATAILYERIGVPQPLPAALLPTA